MFDRSRSTRPRTLLAGGLIGLALLGAGCSSGESAQPGSGGGGHSMPASAAPSAKPLPSDVAPSDVMFAQMMIPHHKQAVQMSDILLGKPGVRPDLAELANQIKGAQQPEIDQMTGWLNDWGQPLEMGHSMGGMEDGMLSPEKLDELQQADTATAQRLYVEGMIAHHQGAVKMAENARRTSKNAAVQKLCDDVIRTQNAEIQTMQGMLPTL
ncbi:DUF305 domain-containing protein [Enemella evansiae]|uniref:DUF305 domain-containing protein n=1 Tax=Enemella evansiae TaxID=2016499 RepID=A0A255GFZ3_9ACTN|nr:DUF305 domain-containing protein [Enemella evansiae]OYO10101.1 DUF305 domain-containing protein [Enemella evansiae]OYO13446.1 DUF305 domain-containing protein [Enemella evansiae]